MAAPVAQVSQRLKLRDNRRPRFKIGAANGLGSGVVNWTRVTRNESTWERECTESARRPNR